MKKRILLIILCLFIFILSGCVIQSKDEECNNFYLSEFGIDPDMVTMVNSDCEWEPDDRYGDYVRSFKATIKDTENYEHNLFYHKGCCTRRSYGGYRICISSNEKTQFYENTKNHICQNLNNNLEGSSLGYDETANDRCFNGDFEREYVSRITLSLNHDHMDSDGHNPIETIYVNSIDCKDFKAKALKEVIFPFHKNMEVNILEEGKKSIKVEIVGEDHTLANALRKELWNDSSVKIAGYNISHPLIGDPILLVETDGKKEAKKALLMAVDRLKKKNSEILAKIKPI